MKKITLALSLLFTFNSYANNSIVKHNCADYSILQFVVTQKFDDNHYVAITHSGNNIPASRIINDYAVIETLYPPSLDYPLRIYMKYIKTKELTLQNGFNVSVDFYKQCKYKIKENTK